VRYSPGNPSFFFEGETQNQRIYYERNQNILPRSLHPPLLGLSSKNKLARSFMNKTCIWETLLVCGGLDDELGDDEGLGKARKCGDGSMEDLPHEA